MAGKQQDATFAEAMKKILQQLSVVGTMPDADLDFVTQLQSAITGRLRAGAQQGGMPGMPPGGPPGAGGPPGMPPGGPGGPPGGPPMLPGGGPAAGGPSPMGGAMGGLSPQGVNPDELRRVLGATGASR